MEFWTDGGLWIFSDPESLRTMRIHECRRDRQKRRVAWNYDGYGRHYADDWDREGDEF